MTAIPRPRSFLFIGGAPRTGTSMLLRSLDWHPDILMFPREVTHLANLYYSGQWVRPADQAKELMFGNSAAIESFRQVFAGHEQELFDYYGTFSASGFRLAFDRAMQSSAANPIRQYFEALASALLGGSPRESQRYGNGNPTLAFKLPYFSEAAFDTLHELSADVRLIHLRRNPQSRYLSAKARTSNPRRGAPGLMDYTTFQALLPAASLTMANAAKRSHPNDVHFTTYEEMRSGAGGLGDIAAFLKVDWDNVLTQQTLHGYSQHLPSAYGFRNEGGESDDGRRHRAAQALANQAELAYVTALDEAAGGQSYDLHTIMELGNEPFVDEPDEARNLRQSFLKEQLQRMIAEGAGAEMARTIRTHRLGAM